VDVDTSELFRACARTGTALEVNASPERLDLPSEHIRNAKDAGVKFAIDTDAHSIGHLDNMKYGVGTAAARLADRGRRHQRLAAGTAPGIPSQGPFTLNATSE
jgi:histidinol phosphatase-like PHP family hydrolase